MLKLEKSKLKHMADIKYQEIAANIHAKMNEADIESLLSYVREAQSYGIHNEKEISLYVECAWKIEKSGYDMDKIRKLMQNQDLSLDHKLIPIRMLTDVIERRNLHGSNSMHKL